jgi:Trypsin-like peptidase domain
MPFLTRNAICFLFVEAFVVSGARPTTAEENGVTLRTSSAPRLIDQSDEGVRPGESIRVASSNLLKYAVKLRAKDTRSALASGVNTADGIVTCAHVVDGFSEFTVDCDGESATAKVVNVDNAHDLALLSVKWLNPHSQAILTDRHPSPEEQLTSVGRQKDGTFSIELHSLQKIENCEYLYSNPPQEGRSGSGVFTSEGKLVGIVLGKIVDIEPYIGRAATVDDVAKLVKVGGPKAKVDSKREVILVPPNQPLNATSALPLSNDSHNPSRASSIGVIPPRFIGLNGQKTESAPR